eukprot:9120528-Alexandrium_andersonii.AAC.1
MGDATIADIPHFRNWESDTALAESEPSGARRGRQEGQTYRGDITGAVLDSGLVESARAEEIRFTESWHVWSVRPISECLARIGKRPIGGRWVDHNKGDAETPN